MRSLFILLGMLLLPFVSAAPEGVPDAPERMLTAADGAEEALQCIMQAGTGLDGLTGGSCTLPVCSPVFIELETEPPGATPVLRPECVWDAITLVRGIVGI